MDDQQFANPGVWPGLELEPDDRLVPPLLQLLGHLLAQVACVFVQLDLGVAGHPEERGINNLHAGKDRIQVVLEDVVETDEHISLARSLGPQSNPRRQHVGHLDPRETAHAGLGIAEDHPQRGREIGEKRERVRWIERQGDEHGEDIGQEIRSSLCALLCRQLVPIGQPDAVPPQLDHQGGECLALLLEHAEHPRECPAATPPPQPPRSL